MVSMRGGFDSLANLRTRLNLLIVTLAEYDESEYGCSATVKFGDVLMLKKFLFYQILYKSIIIKFLYSCYLIE